MTNPWKSRPLIICATPIVGIMFQIILMSFDSGPGDKTIFRANRVLDRKSTRLNSSHLVTSYAVFRLKKAGLRPALRRRGGVCLRAAHAAGTARVGLCGPGIRCPARAGRFDLPLVLFFRALADDRLHFSPRRARRTH